VLVKGKFEHTGEDHLLTKTAEVFASGYDQFVPEEIAIEIRIGSQCVQVLSQPAQPGSQASKRQHMLTLPSIPMRSAMCLTLKKCIAKRLQRMSRH
jgi:hypothetical protein